MSVNKKPPITQPPIELVDFNTEPWRPHPTIAGVTTRFRRLSAPIHPMLDTMIARLEAGELIPWHRHGESAELAYVLEGRGRLWQAAGEEDAAVRAETAAALGNTAALGANTAAALGNPAAVGASPAAGPAAPAGPARAEAREIGPGSAIFIPVGAWHAVENTETSALVIFAVHTDAGGRETSDAP